MPGNEKLYDSTMASAAAAEPHSTGEENDGWDEDGAEANIPVDKVDTTQNSKTGTK